MVRLRRRVRGGAAAAPGCPRPRTGSRCPPVGAAGPGDSRRRPQVGRGKTTRRCGALAARVLLNGRYLVRQADAETLLAPAGGRSEYGATAHDRPEFVLVGDVARRAVGPRGASVSGEWSGGVDGVTHCVDPRSGVALGGRHRRVAEKALDGEDIAVGGVGGGGEAVSQAVQVPSGWESSAGEFRGPSRADVSTIAGGECPAIGTCVAAGADEGVDGSQVSTGWKWLLVVRVVHRTFLTSLSPGVVYYAIEEKTAK